MIEHGPDVGADKTQLLAMSAASPCEQVAADACGVGRGIELRQGLVRGPLQPFGGELPHAAIAPHDVIGTRHKAMAGVLASGMGECLDGPERVGINAAQLTIERIR